MMTCREETSHWWKENKEHGALPVSSSYNDDDDDNEDDNNNRSNTKHGSKEFLEEHGVCKFHKLLRSNDVSPGHLSSHSYKVINQVAELTKSFVNYERIDYPILLNA